jgi:DNA-binding XRE family transcriptional regulator
VGKLSAGAMQVGVESVSMFAEALRRARGLTQAELAERAQLSERGISDLGAGVEEPPASYRPVAR